MPASSVHAPLDLYDVKPSPYFSTMASMIAMASSWSYSSPVSESLRPR